MCPWLSGRKTQVALEDKLRKLEEECKQREAERVSLELELTDVKESLKKALAGGVTLGLAIEPKSGTSSPQVSVLLAHPRGQQKGAKGKCLDGLKHSSLTVGAAVCTAQPQPCANVRHVCQLCPESLTLNFLTPSLKFL
jgi:actin filament associated protein 1